MRMWKRALTLAVLVFICPNIECKRKTDGENSFKYIISDMGVFKTRNGEIAKWRNGEMPKWRNGTKDKSHSYKV